MLLTVVGATTYKLLHSLVAPSKPGEKSYEELTSVLSALFNPAPLLIMCRIKFHSRCHQPGESTAMFVSQLRSPSENCGYDHSLEDMMRDRIVSGVNNDAIQKQLFTEPDLKFSKAVKLAQAMESAAKDVKEM